MVSLLQYFSIHSGRVCRLFFLCVYVSFYFSCPPRANSGHRSHHLCVEKGTPSQSETDKFDIEWFSNLFLRISDNPTAFFASYWISRPDLMGKESTTTPSRSQAFETARVCDQAADWLEASGGSPSARYLRTGADVKHIENKNARS